MVSRQDVRVAYTLVSFHAHPDDEALLTAGTLARAAAEGHRVVVVVATAGEAGLAAAASHGVVSGGPSTGSWSLGETRMAELSRSAAVLGCARVELLGYDDSGTAGTAGAHARPFAHADVEEAAGRLATVLREERADVLTVYDAAGGYGHPDHVAVHRVGVRAAELAATPVVLEATVDRTLLQRALRLLGRFRHLPPDFSADRFDGAYTSRAELTHRVDVRRFTRQKRSAMVAHATQSTGGDTSRTLAVCLRLPRPLFRLAFGHEWFTERGRVRSGKLLDDVFASLRPPAG